jgi:ketosteroid isomerase-like protein
MSAQEGTTVTSTKEEAERAATMRIVESYLPLFTQQRWDEWIDLWADDGVLEFPYAPPGRQSRYVGKSEILAYIQPQAGKLNVEKLEYQRIYPMLDPTMIVMELGIDAEIAATGARLRQKYVCVFQTRAGKLWQYREYWNPVTTMDANGGREAWTNGFGKPAAGDRA